MTMFDGQSVTTPYGRCIVEKIRGECVVVRPTNWHLANNQPPTFYLNKASVQPFFNISEKVVCTFGIGIVQDIRNDGIYIVTLTNWQLANGKSPTLYLNEKSLSKTTSSSAKTEEKKAVNPNSFALVFKDALAEKELAKVAYMAQRFEEAKLRYASAAEIMRRVNEEMTNEEKGRFFELSLTCSSNLALCSWGLKEYGECVTLARNALTLIDAMESKIGNSELWKAMVETNVMTFEKMRELKVKALRMVAKSEVHRKNYEQAKIALEVAVPLVAPEVKLHKELNDLLIEVSKKLAAEEKREKNVWQKAFKKGGKGEGDLYTSNQDKVPDESKSTPEPLKSPTKEKETQDSKKKEEENNQLWKADNFFRGPVFGSFVFMGVLGLLGTAAYWWSRRRR